MCIIVKNVYNCKKWMCLTILNTRDYFYKFISVKYKNLKCKKSLESEKQF